MSGPIETQVKQILNQGLEPFHLSILNESPQHGLPASAEKHFRVVVVSDQFDGLARLDRQRRVNALLAELLKTHIHALAMQTFTPEEWTKANGQTLASPACLGGGKQHGKG